MWLVAVRETMMQLKRNLSFVFSPILLKQCLILPYKACSKYGNCVGAENQKKDFGVSLFEQSKVLLGTEVGLLLFRSVISSL